MPLFGCVAVVAWLSLAEWKLLDRLLFVRDGDLAFVVAAVHGVMHGTPVSKSWQQRWLGPLCVTGLERLGLSPEHAVKAFLVAMLVAANVLVVVLLRRTPWRALGAVAALGLLRLLFVYRLEYPWDGIDVILFLLVGHLAAQRAPLARTWPLVAIGLFNHETVLYIPLWYLISGDNRARVRAATVAVALGGVIWLARRYFYIGRPDMPGQDFEATTPLISNHLHVAHNLGTLFGVNWLVLGVIAALAVALRRPSLRAASIWSLAVIATILCFGFTNETRHYLPLIGFWVAYTATT